MIALNLADCLILFLPFLWHHLWITNDDTWRPEIVFECLTLSKKFRREQQTELTTFAICKRFHLCKLLSIFHIEWTAIANRNRWLDYHCRLWINRKNEVNHILNMVCIEEVLYRVIVGRCSNNYKICIFISGCSIKGCSKVEFLFCEVFFNILVLYRRDTIVNLLHLFRNNINSSHFVVLCQKSCNTQTDITGTGYSNLEVFKISHILAD